MHRIARVLTAPNIWVGVFSVIALVGVLLAATGVFVKATTLADLGWWLTMPLLFGGTFLAVVGIPTLLIAKSLRAARRRSDTDRTITPVMSSRRDCPQHVDAELQVIEYFRSMRLYVDSVIESAAFVRSKESRFLGHWGSAISRANALKREIETREHELIACVRRGDIESVNSYSRGFAFELDGIRALLDQARKAIPSESDQPRESNQPRELRN